MTEAVKSEKRVQHAAKGGCQKVKLKERMYLITRFREHTNRRRKNAQI